MRRTWKWIKDHKDEILITSGCIVGINIFIGIARLIVMNGFEFK